MDTKFFFKSAGTFWVIFYFFFLFGEARSEMVFHLSGKVTSFDLNNGYLDLKKGKEHYRVVGDEKFIEKYKNKPDDEYISIDYKRVFIKKSDQFINIMTNKKINK